MEKNNEGIKKYQDLDNISMNKLSLGLWYVEKRQAMIKLLKYFLIFISIISWSYFFYGFGYYIFFGMKMDDRMLNELTQNSFINHDSIVQNGAKDLIINNPIILRQNGRNDLYSIIQNPNEKFFAKFDFVYRIGEKELKREKSFALPSDQNFLIAFNQELNGSEDPQISIENVRWKRLNPHLIPDWANYKNAHLNFEITDTSVVKADDLNQADNKSINFAEVKFSVKNNTAYNYLAPEFIIVFRNGYGISGINKYVINNFKSGEKRDCVLNWADAPQDNSNLEIIPNINIIDGDVYYKFDSGSVNLGEGNVSK
jgi:hypothetical protein